MRPNPYLALAILSLALTTQVNKMGGGVLVILLANFVLGAVFMFCWWKFFVEQKNDD